MKEANNPKLKLKKESGSQFIRAGGENIEITHADKVLYPSDHLTKFDIAQYYKKIASILLPHAKDRVVSMQHFPDGINGENFYQKRVPDYFPKWFKTARVGLHAEGGSEEVAVIQKEADLVYLANLAVLPIHIWLSRVGSINKPDKIVFDLDPSGTDYSGLRFAAQKIREKFEKMGFSVYVMTSGANGFHICIPIKPTKAFDQVRDFTHTVAGELAKEYPKDLTIEMAKDKRRGRIFLDYLRNSYGQTSICPYSLRAESGAPVAAPFRWSEIGRIKPQSFNIKSIFTHIKGGDPWRGFYSNARPLP